MKINTGAAVPAVADAIIQVEDTKVVSAEGGVERIVEILTKPEKDIDIRYNFAIAFVSCTIFFKLLFARFHRAIGSDLAIGAKLFRSKTYPGHVPYKSLLASIGVNVEVFS